MNATATSGKPARAPSKRSWAWNLTLILIPVLTAAALFTLWHLQVKQHSKRVLGSYGKVPAFQLLNQNGAQFGSAQLAGKIWIADFIFTTCPGPCPLISSRMAELQKPLEKTDAQLVSFTVDPQTDTPEVLREYAQRLKAPPERWNFLTGNRDAIYDLIQNGFKVGVSDGSAEEVVQPVHSTRVVLVDRTGTIRGYYDALAPDAVTIILADATQLLRER